MQHVRTASGKRCPGNREVLTDDFRLVPWSYVLEHYVKKTGDRWGRIANALAASNLANGLAVVADCVNPGRATREGWRTTAASVGARIVEIEIICSDLDEHRRRVETRQFDIDGLILPSWQHVLQRDYTSWVEPHLVIDTAGFTPDQAITVIEGHIAAA